MITARIYFAGSPEGYFSDDFYDIDTGMTLSREFNEKLDSATISLSNIPTGRRLDYVQPYSYAYFEIGDSDGGEKYARTMLVDSIVETSGLIIADSVQYYSYTIKLMSETKMLEKIQLPNRTFTHSLAGERKTIDEAIQELCDLYMPKIKAYDRETGGWYYEKLIEVDTSVTEFKIFDVPCADISMSSPTLRQALTSLMVQVGCLPVVRDGRLTYVNLNAEATEIPSDGFNEFVESNSSDSFITSLVTTPTQVIDEGNQVVNEMLGFRDRNNVFLKSDSNLKLETRFPIYQVKSAKLRFYRYISVDMGVGSLSTTILTDTLKPEFGYDENGANFGLWIDARGHTSATPTVYTVSGTMYQIDASSGRWEITKTMPIVGSKVTVSEARQSIQLAKVSDMGATYPKEGDPKFGYVFTLAVLTIDGGKRLYTADTMATMLPKWSPNRSLFVADTANNRAVARPNIGSLYQKDITPLFVENSKRSLLDTDYLKMGTATSISELSRYIFATVGYSIGGKEITGFSSKYSKTSGWFNSTYTYIENIVNTVWRFDKQGEVWPTQADFFGANPYFSEAINEEDVASFDVSLTYNDKPGIIDPWGRTTSGLATIGSTYPFVFFDISYIPLGDSRMVFPKTGEHPYEIEQFDGSENGLVASRSYGLSENEKSARLGNAVLSVHRRVQSVAEWLAFGDGLNRLVKGARSQYTTFSETITINGSAIDIAMNASKDYVLKNYFTSVVTKYRAYENVDYDKATLRKEGLLVYADIERYYYNGTDRLHFGPLNGRDYNATEQFRFLDGPFRKEGETPYTYGFQSSKSKDRTELSELSTICGETRAIFTMRDFDNASLGIYMTKRATGSDGEYNDDFGQPQSWYLNDGFTETPYIGFTRGTDYFTDKVLYSVSAVKETSGFQTLMQSSVAYPLVDSQFFDPFNGNGHHGFFVLGSNGRGWEWNETEWGLEPLAINKDNAETMQYSVQIEYVSHDSRVQLFEGFPRACSAVGNLPTTKVARGIYIHTTAPKGLYDSEDNAYITDIAMSLVSNAMTRGNGSSGHASFIVNWERIFAMGGDYLTVTYHDGTKLTDLMSIKASKAVSGKEEWFLNFTDTNSGIVYDMEDSRGNLWSPRKRMATNTNERSCKAL